MIIQRLIKLNVFACKNLMVVTIRLPLIVLSNKYDDNEQKVVVNIKAICLALK